MINYKKYFRTFNDKIKANKKIYGICIIIILILIWLILGNIGLTIGIIYLILRLSVVQRQIPKLKNRKIAAIFVIVVPIILFGLIFGVAEFMQALTNHRLASFIPEPPNVTFTTIKETKWKQDISAIGEAQAPESTQISSQSGGIVSEINFKSGQEVKKGDLLFKLDTSQLEANLEKAISKLKLTKITADRYNKLVRQRATSKESADKADSDYLSALAEVRNIESQINFKEIRAPFDGKIGIRNINLGQYFNNGDNAATLTKISPIYIEFSVPQKKVGLVKIGQNIDFFTDAFPNKKFRAKVTAVNSFINDSNRSILVRASYKNPKHNIVPGMFLDVHINLPSKGKSIVVPRNAIAYSLYGESILTLTPELNKSGKPKKAIYTSGGNIIKTNKTLYKVGEVNIKVLETRNNLALVKGLKPNTVIVTSGQNKLHKGMDVMLDKDVKFNNDIYTQGDM
ncbi:efflux RND transporter periplasmic adaptor subunit [Francisella sp. SYW-9]|uniref:efflux RND transporter periplasmic adaptor subunit n=1 Tax=Francisella sp. SYW-9 TaxID=2610888 RepID=UPI00123C96C8|nr:efflux RND transporter periplasmic adaptor subunit [Francisella sp. SYW-9]